jgi:hypothetical protein
VGPIFRASCRDEAAGVRPRELGQAGCSKLTTAALRIDEDLDLVCQLGFPTGRLSWWRSAGRRGQNNEDRELNHWRVVCAPPASPSFRLKLIFTYHMN